MAYSQYNSRILATQQQSCKLIMQTFKSKQLFVENQLTPVITSINKTLINDNYKH